MFRFPRMSVAIGLIAVMIFANAGDVSGAGRRGLRLAIYDNSSAGWGGEEWEAFEPWRDGPEGTRCAYTRVANIDNDFNTSIIGSCPTYGEDGVEDILAHFTGYMKVPRSGLYTLYVRVDDGFYLKVGSKVVLKTWFDQGDSAYNDENTVRLSRGRSYKVDAWYYENGGGDIVQLFYSLNGSEPTVVPSPWFSERP